MERFTGSLTLTVLLLAWGCAAQEATFISKAEELKQMGLLKQRGLTPY